VKVEAFTEQHLAPAANLLVVARKARTAGPPAQVSDEDAALRALSEALPGAFGFAAMDGAELVGFFLVVRPSAPGSERVRISDLHHAADHRRARVVYRALYEAAAGRLVSLGCFDHRIRLLVEPAEPVSAFVEMGFGVDQIKGVRPIDSAPIDEQVCSVQPARPEDLADLTRLGVELAAYHSRSPVLGPALVDLPGIRAEIVATVEDPRRAILCARDGPRVIGMIEAHPDAYLQNTVTVGLNIVTESARSGGVGSSLLEAVLRWGQASGYGHCGVSWASANLVSDAFYRARGFVPIRYEVARRIDPRVSWANESFDFEVLG
jgi:GNAT superfamily N-acetyltransferase